MSITLPPLPTWAILWLLGMLAIYLICEWLMRKDVEDEEKILARIIVVGLAALWPILLPCYVLEKLRQGLLQLARKIGERRA